MDKENNIFRPPNTLGLLLNVSMRMVGGIRLAEQIKTELIDYVSCVDGEDTLCFAGQTRLCENAGQWVAAIGNWQPQEVPPRLSQDVEKLINVISMGDPDGIWRLCVITDRYRPLDEKWLNTVKIHRSPWTDLCVLLVTVGSHYHFREYKNACSFTDIKYSHLNNSSGLKDVLSNWIGD